MALDVELAEIRDFLAQHAPFDSLPADVLEGLPKKFSVEYHRRGTAIVPAGSENRSLYVLRSGAVDIHGERGALVDRSEVGDVFGAITADSASATIRVTAIEDTLVLVLPEEGWRALCESHQAFAHFFDHQRAHRMKGAVATLQSSGTSNAMLKTGVSDLIRREPITTTTAASVREAAQIMRDRRVSSLLVMDGSRLAGIVTDRDLRNRVLAEGLTADVLVRDVMTADPVTGDSGALAFEVLLEMVGRNIHHLPILDGQRPLGVVTTTDLMRMVQASPIYVVGDVQKQRDVAGVAAVTGRLPAVVESLVAQDATAEDIGRVVTAIGDAVERRVLELIEAELTAELGPPPVPYCWITLGSRARLEQALAADQDHAMIVADEATEADMAWFAQLADRVTAALAECGYPPCTGEIMASNPRWRLRLRDWKHEFTTWLTQPVPEAILRASIFFDLRALYGQTNLLTKLERTIYKRSPEAKLFLAHLAKAATHNEPPLGFFRGFVLAKEGAHRDTLDIKRGGIGAVVELARVHALALGSPALTTRARIGAAVHGGIMSEEKGADLCDAFEFISYVRLRHQAAQVSAGQPVDNFVNPELLSSFDKRNLREAFAIVRAAQSTMASRYPTNFM